MKTPLLDTDTISYFLKGNASVIRQMNEMYQRDEALHISVITYYEIMNGLLFKNARKQLESFQELAVSCQIIHLDTAIADLAAEIYAELRRNNQMIGHTDVLIGATAIYHNMTIITNNQAHFSRISNLELDNWM
jgi:tRNA(fMet)-specific endonuclease VapC